MAPPEIAIMIRLLASILLLIVGRFVRVVTRQRETSVIVWSAGVLVGREVALLVIPSAWALPVRAGSDIVVILLILWWTGRYRRTNRTSWAATVLSGILVTFGVIAWTLSGAASSGIAAAPLRALWYLVPPALMTTLTVTLFRLDRFSGPDTQSLNDIKPLLIGVLAVATVLYLVVPLRFPLFSYLSVPTATVSLWLLSGFFLHRSLTQSRDKTRRMRENGQTVFDFLSHVGRSLGGGLEPEAILATAIDTIVSAVSADAGVAVISDAAGARVCAVHGIFPPPTPVPDVVKTKQGALEQFLRTLPVTEETPLWGDALQSGSPRLIEDARAHPVLRMHADDRVLHLSSMMILPLVIRGRTLGLLSLVRRERGVHFTASDLDHGRTMADFVAVTLDNFYNYRLQRDVEIAAQIQERLQAPPVITHQNVHVAGLCRPARQVGGDYYDVVPLADGRTAVLVCDVSGKGVPAALVMVMVRTIAHSVLAGNPHAGEVLTAVNRGICGAVAIDRFATVSVVVIDPLRGEIAYANAGHHPTIVLTPGASAPHLLDSDELPIGIDPDAAYTERRADLPPGSIVALYTDGVVEQGNPQAEEFGSDRLVAALRQGLNDTSVGSDALDAEGLAARVIGEIDRFAAGVPQHDDVTLVVCRTTSVGEQ